MQGGFFKTVLTKLGVPAEKILHVGDGTADIIGAQNEKISSCWINRNHSKWTLPLKPDMIISNLNELLSIL